METALLCHFKAIGFAPFPEHVLNCLVLGDETIQSAVRAYIEIMGAMHQCLKIRNLFAHCHWAQFKKRGLFFINLEDAVATPGELRLDAFRYAKPKTLKDLEDYFWCTFEGLDYLAKALAVKTKVMRGPAPNRPRQRPLFTEVRCIVSPSIVSLMAF